MLENDSSASSMHTSLIRIPPRNARQKFRITARLGVFTNLRRYVQVGPKIWHTFCTPYNFIKY